MRKEQIQITVEAEQLKWIDKKIEEGIYGSRSHAIRKGLACLMKVVEKEES